MAYDNYGRPSRNAGEQPGYFGTYDSMPDSDYTSYYHSEPQRNPPPRREDWEYPRRRSPSGDTRMPSDGNYSDTTSASDRDALAALEARLKAQLKQEVLDFEKQLRQRNLDESSRAPPRVPSNWSSESMSPPPTARRVYTPPSPLHQPKSAYPAPPSEEPTTMRSPPVSPLEKPGGVRFSERSARPTANRTYSTLELSTIDQKWGRLFENDGLPTKRLGDVLRGLANHIICSFEPQKTIVVTPSKMAAYYAAYQLDKEPHPLLSIFRGGHNDQISVLYQELGCQHHLVQENPNSAPIVPALTATGFAHWMTLHITAYPDEEWNRLEKVVPHLPVDADGDLVDGKPERLPKQISRHLLPERVDPEARRLVDSAISGYMREMGTAPRRKASITPAGGSRRSSNSQKRPPVEIHQTRTSPTTANIPPILERDRKPYASAPVSDEETGPNNIERQRQPYSTQPGVGGKVYADTINPNRSERSDSTSTRTTNNNPPRGRNHSNSTAGQTYIPTAQRSRRTSSPPMKSFRNTAPENINDSSRYGPSSTSAFNPGSFGSTGSFPPPPTNDNAPRDSRENRRPRDERSWAGSVDELRNLDLNGPRDAELLDRYRDAYGEGGRGALPDEWVRRESRNDDYYRDRDRRY